MPRMADLQRYAQLCELAYLDWTGWDGPGAPDLAGHAVQGGALPPAAAADLLGPGGEGWRLAAPSRENDRNGFSASLWQPGVAHAGPKVLAIRGVELGLDSGSPSQVVADLLQTSLADIGLAGLALGQAVSMFNYLQCLRAPAGAGEVLQLQLRSAFWPPEGAGTVVVARQHLWLEARHDGLGLGAIAPGERLAVTGHSLGGHLAGLALRLFPDLFTEACAFNAPGFDPPSSLGLTSAGLALFAPWAPAAAADWTGLADRLYWVEAEDVEPGDDVDLVAGSLAGRAPAPRLVVATETNSHGVDMLVDALRLHGLLELLDPALPRGEYASLLAATSARRAAAGWSGLPTYWRNEDAHERLLAGLHELVLGRPAQLAPVAHSLTRAQDFPAREGFHAAALAVHEALRARPVEGRRVLGLDGLTADALAQAARGPDGLSWRYALATLSPYVVTGDEALFGEARRRALTLEGEAPAGEAAVTAEWLARRAAMLALALEARRLDREEVVGGLEGGPALRYVDATTGESFLRTPALTRGEVRQVLFGRDQSGGGERLEGGPLADALFGLAGEDTLEGGQGPDWLEGGRGADCYLDLGEGDQVVDLGGEDLYFVDGPGTVRLRDADGLGRLFHRGEPLVGGRYEGEGRFRSLDGRQVYLVQPDGSLLVELDEGRTRVELTGQDWSRPALGLRLDGAAEGYAVRGSAQAQTVLVEGARVRLDGELLSFPDPPSRLYGGGGDDTLAVQPDLPGLVVFGDGGGVGTDGQDGDDLIDLDRDRKTAGERPLERDGGATVHGEGGEDVVLGSLRDDALFGEAGHDALAGEWGADRLAGGEGNDLLDGGEHDDLLAGQDAEDVLLGGAGADTLLGGAGADRLHGDGTQPDPFAWRGREGRFVLREGQVAELLDAPAAAHGADALFGGPGADALHGGGGEDRLFGEEDADLLLGEAGHDWLDGGPGDDVLWGDYDPALWLADGLSLGSTLAWPPPRFEQVEVPYVGRAHAFPSDAVGQDTLLGGRGNDLLWGGEGDDLYQFLPGDGVDFILDTGGQDTLWLPGHTAAQVTLAREGGEVLVEFRAGGGPDGDVVVLFGGTGAGGIERIAFADGTSWEASAVQARLGGAGPREGRRPAPARPRAGSLESDLLEGGEAAESLFGLGGDDRLLGAGGADRLHGGQGEDVLEGGAGEDALHGGEGSDRLLGGPGDDVLEGGEGEDWLEGGEGADALKGGGGADRYVFAPGWGTDLLQELDAEDLLVFGPGVSAESLRVRADGTDLILAAGEREEVVLAQWLARPHLGGVVFEDGRTWDAQALLARANVLTGTEAPDRLRAGAVGTVLEGLAGADLLEGGAGDDLLRGGEGEDVLDGGGGENRLEGGPGADLFRVGSPGARDWLVDAQDAPARVAFAPGVTRAGLRASRHGQDLVLGFAATDARLTVGGYYDAPSNWRFELAGGQPFGLEDIGPGSEASPVGPAREQFEQEVLALLHAEARWSNESGQGIEAPLGAVVYVDAPPRVLLPNALLLEGHWWYPGVVNQAVTSEWGWLQGRPSRLERHGVRVHELHGGPADEVFLIGAHRESGATTLERASLALASRQARSFEGGLPGRRVFEVEDLVFENERGPRLPGALQHEVAVRDHHLVLIRIRAGGGDDVVHGEGGSAHALLEGGAGNDQLAATSHTRAFLDGGEGEDVLQGRNGADVLHGGPGADVLVGDAWSWSEAGAGDLYLVEAGDTGVDLVEDPGLFVGGNFIAYALLAGQPGSGAPWGATRGEALVALRGRLQGASAAQGEALVDWIAGRSELDRADMPPSVDTLRLGVPFAAVRPAWGEWLEDPLAAQWGARRRGVFLEWGAQGTRHGVLVLEPHPWGFDALGYGVERYEFSDRVLGRAELAAFLPEAEAPARYLRGTGGPDLWSGSDGGLWFDAGGGDDVLAGGGGEDLLEGGEGDDLLEGGAGRDELRGGPGADRLDGGPGQDLLRAGPGEDTYLFGPGGGHDRIEEEGGEDRLLLAAGTVGALEQLSARRHGEDLVLEFGSGDALTLGGWYAGPSARIERVELDVEDPATGLRHWVVLSAEALEQRVSRAARAPLAPAPLAHWRLEPGALAGYSLAEDAFLDPDAGESLVLTATLADGSPLPPWLGFSPAQARLTALATVAEVGRHRLRISATDPAGLQASAELELTVDLPGASPGTNGADRLVAGEARGTLLGLGGDDDLRGGPAEDALHGGPGADSLDGAGGADLMAGGPGDDLYRVDSLADRVLERPGEGVDGVEAGVSFALPGAVEVLALREPGGARVGRGNDADNALLGNGLANLLSGGRGRDLLDGSDGPDLLLGGAGADRLLGGAGEDWLQGGDGDDWLDGGDGTDVASYLGARRGVRVDLALGQAQATGQGRDVLRGIERVVGSAHDDRLAGDEGDNLLSGGAGADRLTGRRGNDILAGGPGEDLYQFGRGDGQDLLRDEAGEAGVLRMGPGIAPEDLWFWRAGEHLRVGLRESADRVTVEDWYGGGQAPRLRIEAGGRALAGAGLEALVAAMAVFDPEREGHTRVPEPLLLPLLPLIAPVWQPA